MAQPVPYTWGVGALTTRISVDGEDSENPWHCRLSIVLVTVVKVAVMEIDVSVDGATVALPKLIDFSCHAQLLDLTFHKHRACV